MTQKEPNLTKRYYEFAKRHLIDTPLGTRGFLFISEIEKNESNINKLSSIIEASNLIIEKCNNVLLKIVELRVPKESKNILRLYYHEKSSNDGGLSDKDHLHDYIYEDTAKNNLKIIQGIDIPCLLFDYWT